MPGPDIDLSGKTALVTGASRGIGLAIARVLAKCGADVIGVGTTISQNAQSYEETFEGLRGRFFPMNCDLSDRKALAGMLAKISASGTSIDILVNNAGVIHREEAATHSTDAWDAVMAINLDAVFLLSREIGKKMLDRGQGKIINIASVLSFQGGILVPGYAAAKGAVGQLTRSFANEWASHGINVNAVAPGYVATDNTASLQQDADRTAALMARIPVGRWGNADEIAWPVAFLASEMASFIHGAVLPVDGGWLAR